MRNYIMERPTDVILLFSENLTVTGCLNGITPPAVRQFRNKTITSHHSVIIKTHDHHFSMIMRFYSVNYLSWLFRSLCSCWCRCFCCCWCLCGFRFLCHFRCRCGSRRCKCVAVCDLQSLKNFLNFFHICVVQPSVCRFCIIVFLFGAFQRFSLGCCGIFIQNLIQWTGLRQMRAITLSKLLSVPGHWEISANLKTEWSLQRTQDTKESAFVQKLM